MAKRGRPASENPRNVKVDIRLTEDESRRLLAYAERLGLSKTEVLVQGLEALEQKEKRKRK